MAVTCDYASPDDELTVNYHFDADSMTIYPADHPAVLSFVEGGGAIAAYITPEPYVPPAAPPHLNNGGLARFSGTAPVNVFENIRLGAVTRVTKGRWRTALIEAIPQGYSPIVGYIDAAVRNVRVSACTATYVEVKATDAAGAAADCEQIIVKIERVIS